MIEEPYPNAGVTLRCPNEPEDKEGMLFADEKHEAFSLEFRATMTIRLLNNGRQWFFDNPIPTARDQETLGPVFCRACGAEAIINEVG